MKALAVESGSSAPKKSKSKPEKRKSGGQKKKTSTKRKVPATVEVAGAPTFQGQNVNYWAAALIGVGNVSSGILNSSC